jgi:hypothetical protein
MKTHKILGAVSILVVCHSQFAFGKIACPDWITNLNEKEYIDLLHGTRVDIAWGLGNEKESLKNDKQYYVFKLVPGPEMVMPEVCEKTNTHITPVHVSQQIEGKIGDRCQYNYIKSWDQQEATPQNTFYLEVVQVEPVPQ